MPLNIIIKWSSRFFHKMQMIRNLLEFEMYLSRWSPRMIDSRLIWVYYLMYVLHMYLMYVLLEVCSSYMCSICTYYLMYLICMLHTVCTTWSTWYMYMICMYYKFQCTSSPWCTAKVFKLIWFQLKYVVSSEQQFYSVFWLCLFVWVWK